jgi:hypothetical protein
MLYLPSQETTCPEVLCMASLHRLLQDGKGD